MGRAPDERVTSDVGREICVRDGIKALLAGNIDSVGGQYVITLEASNATSGDSLSRQQVQADRKEDVLNALHSAATKLRSQLGESLATVQKYDMSLSQATTSSLEALKSLSLGDAKHNVGDELAAIPNYQRAVELDPNFAMAYARLGTVYGNLGQVELSEQNRQKAFELRDRASEREKLYITEHYYADSGQLDKGITAIELFKQTYPNDSIPYNNLAIIYSTFGQFDNAVINAKRAVELDPDMISGYENLSLAYAGLGRMAEARATLSTVLQKKSAPRILDKLMASYDWAEGRNSDMEKDLAAASSTPQGEVTVSLFRGGLSAARGQMVAAREFARKSGDGLDRLHLTGRSGIESQLGSWEALVGNRAEALNDANEALRLSQTFDAKLSAATIFAVEREEQKALALADEIQRTRPNDTMAQNVAVPSIRAFAALTPANPAKADPAKALDLLNSAILYARSDSGVLFARGIAYRELGRFAEAQQDFQKIIDLKCVTGPSALISVAQLELARIYQKQGDVPKARIGYQNFLAAWKDADPDVPLLKTAKAEYAKLQ
jgi:tetratricopeptide (TPR) repeat protein